MKLGTKKIKFFRDIIIIVLICFGIIISFEWVLRLIYPEKVQSSSLAYKFNKDYLVQLKPNISKFFIRSPENGGNITHWKTNKDSFRGSSLKDSPGYRVIVYGDSNIQARFSEIKKTFTGQLDHYLRKFGIQDIEIINAGVVGFGPDQALIRFEKEANKYKPDLVIFHIFADNDFGDIIRNRLFALDAHGNLISLDYKKTIDTELLHNKHKTIKSYISELLIVKSAREIVSGLSNKREKEKKKDRTKREKRITKHLLKKVEAEYLVYKEHRPKQFSHFADHYDIDIALNTKQEPSKVKIRLMDQILRQANNYAHSKGIKFLVLIQPSTIDLTKENFVLGYKYLQKYPNYKRTNLTGEFENICKFNNIHYINLFNVFLENHPKNLYFRAGDDHWNDRGQKLAAKVTADYIIQQSMIGK